MMSMSGSTWVSVLRAQTELEEVEKVWAEDGGVFSMVFSATSEDSGGKMLLLTPKTGVELSSMAMAIKMRVCADEVVCDALGFSGMRDVAFGDAGYTRADDGALLALMSGTVSMEML